jgi:hypothetical protein
VELSGTWLKADRSGKPRSGERSVAHGVSHGINTDDRIEAPEGRNIDPRIYRSAALRLMWNRPVTHG